METLYPSFMISDSCWFSSATEWTKEENKRFESALAMISEQDPLRWFKVAAFVPGKTVDDVIKQYRELLEDLSNIEAGKVPIPGYLTSSFPFNLVHERDLNGYRKRTLSNKGSDHERKKGIPWTEDEHRRFLMGLVKHGKGDWRNISRNFVFTKTPTQVASHAQKYFIRQQISGTKDKRRPSIHDITTFNLSGSIVPPSDHSLSSSIKMAASPHSQPDIRHNYSCDSNDHRLFDAAGGDVFLPPATSNGVKLSRQNSDVGVRRERHRNPNNFYV